MKAASGSFAAGVPALATLWISHLGMGASCAIHVTHVSRQTP
jgi:hypothetical protein